jgi:hypothetical protein
MIPIQSLKYLIKNKIKDAEVLFKNERYLTSIYLAGYAVEIALKYKICMTLQFNVGFPETQQELSTYLQQINGNNPKLLRITIRQIKNHDLSTLLFYSGVEARIKNLFLNEWAIINTWNPEDRYRKKIIIKNKSQIFLRAAKKLIKEIV